MAAGPKVAKIASKNSPTQRSKARKIIHEGREVVMMLYSGLGNKTSHVVAYKDQVIASKDGSLFARKSDGSIMLWSELSSSSS